MQANQNMETCHFSKNNLHFGSVDFIPPWAGLRYQTLAVACYSLVFDALHLL
jgi:hypothetical protein